MNKWQILDRTYPDASGNARKVFDPHAGQLEFMEDPAKYQTITAGRRMGKSRAIGHEFLPEAALTRKMETWLKERRQTIRVLVGRP
jgi:hypothetical protein